MLYVAGFLNSYKKNKVPCLNKFIFCTSEAEMLMRSWLPASMCGWGITTLRGTANCQGLLSSTLMMAAAGPLLTPAVGTAAGIRTITLTQAV